MISRAEDISNTTLNVKQKTVTKLAANALFSSAALLHLRADCVRLRHGCLLCTFMSVLADIPLHPLHNLHHCDATQPFPFSTSAADATMLTPECAAVITTLPNYILCVFMCRGHVWMHTSASVYHWITCACFLTCFVCIFLYVCVYSCPERPRRSSRL